MNGKWFDQMSKVLVPLAGKLNNNRYLTVLRDAFMLAFPITIFGSIVVRLMNLPFLSLFLTESSLTAFRDAVGNAPQRTRSIISLFVVFGIGLHLTVKKL